MEKHKKKYPIENDILLKLIFAGLYLALPAACLVIGLLSLIALAGDIGVFGMQPGGGSVAFAVIGMSGGLGGAGYLLFNTYRYGWFSGYFFAQSSKAFKRSALSVLERLKKDYTAAGFVDADAQRHLNYCIEKLSDYKKFWLTTKSQNHMESVVFTEIKKAEAVYDSHDFNKAAFLAALKKIHFSIEERFLGVSAKAYQGEGNYAFISYSHRNTKVVLEVIKKLQEANINVWFDEGITEGDDWMDHLAKKIDNCAYFVMFQSMPYSRSHNCNVEVKRALSRKKTIVRIIIEDSKLAEGVEMYLDNIQAINCTDGFSGKMERIIGLLKNAVIGNETVKRETVTKESISSTATATAEHTKIKRVTKVNETITRAASDSETVSESAPVKKPRAKKTATEEIKND